MPLDIRVLDLTQNLAGPYCAQILGDLGADVVKVERPGAGDPARAWGPPFWEGEGPLFLAANRNKRSLALDLKTAEGLEIVRRLVAGADVVLQSFRAGVAERLGLGYADVRALNPRAIYCAISAFGPRGPLRELPGYDPLMQAYAGLMSVNGHPGQPPSRVGTSLVDMGTGMWAAIGVLAALGERERTGVGSQVGASLFETALAWNAYHLLGYFGTGRAPGPAGAGFPSIAPYEAFPTADGRLMIAAANDGLFLRLCRALELPELAADPRFRDNPSRVAHRAELYERIAVRTAAEPTAGVEARLREAGVPCAPILDVAGIAAEEQTRATGILQPAAHARIPRYRAVGLPLEFDGERPAARRAPPIVGEHTREILRELGYDDERIAALEASGVVEQGDPER
ncbi:MAG: CoA transferase [Gemmatimonadetes bacterium]|nr:CoA transferase [Gemmatimonadota bacterium]